MLFRLKVSFNHLTSFKHVKLIISLVVILLTQLLSYPTLATEVDDESYVHYAFSNYIGSGLYRTSGQNATVVNIPISFQLQEDENSSLHFRAPLSFGFFNFSWTDLPEGEFPEQVGTVTVTTGIEYRVSRSDKHQLISYMDFGYGHNYSDNSQVGIFSAGTASVLEFEHERMSPIWANRLYYAGFRDFDSGYNESYSALQSGLDIGTGIYWDWQWLRVEVEPRFFVVGYWYFNQLGFAQPVGEDILIESSFEIGTSLAFSKPLLWDWMGVDRLGVSIRSGDGLHVWRLHFSLPI